jgi:hypothetical protein
MSYAVENAVFQWEEGFRALQAARSGSAADRAFGKAVLAVQDELRKRLGSSFTIAELAALYREGTDWALDVTLVGDDDEPALPGATAVDAAFYLYMREASDFAGGSPRPPAR